MITIYTSLLTKSQVPPIIYVHCAARRAEEERHGLHLGARHTAGEREGRALLSLLLHRVQRVVELEGRVLGALLWLRAALLVVLADDLLELGHQLLVRGDKLEEEEAEVR